MEDTSGIRSLLLTFDFVVRGFCYSCLFLCSFRDMFVQVCVGGLGKLGYPLRFCTHVDDHCYPTRFIGSATAILFWR